MKRFTACVLVCALCLALGACGTPPVSSGDAVPAPQQGGVDLSLEDAEILPYNAITGAPLAEGVTPGQRPVAVMVDNSFAAMPQRGIGSADALVEMVTEGGITRIMALYGDPAAVPTVGPVRSARDQFLELALPLKAIVVHIGSSLYASNMLNYYQYKTVDGFHSGTTAFALDAEQNKTRAQEHCWYTDTALIMGAVAAGEMDLVTESHSFLPFLPATQVAQLLTGGDAPELTFSFSDLCAVRFSYDAARGYLKEAYGAPHIDERDGSQLAFDNVLVLEAALGLKPDNYCTDFSFAGGRGYYLCGGKYQEIRWEKGAVENALRFTDTAGKELRVTPGKSYLGVIDTAHFEQIVLGAAPIIE